MPPSGLGLELELVLECATGSHEASEQKAILPTAREWGKVLSYESTRDNNPSVQYSRERWLVLWDTIKRYLVPLCQDVLFFRSYPSTLPPSLTSWYRSKTIKSHHYYTPNAIEKQNISMNALQLGSATVRLEAWRNSHPLDN